MMFLLIIGGLAISFSHVTSVICGNVSLGKLTISSVECRSMEDIVFDFIADNDNKSRQTLAECHASKQSCYLRDKSLSSSYAISFTGSGAIFSVVNKFGVARGKYFCCRAYSNQDDCVQLDTAELPYNAFNSDQDENNQEKTDRNQDIQTSRVERMLTIITIITIVLTVACVVNSAILVALVWRTCNDKGSLSSIGTKSHNRVSQYEEETFPPNEVSECDEETIPLNEAQNGVQRRGQSITCRNSCLTSWKDTVAQTFFKLVTRTIEEHTYEHDIAMNAHITCGDILTVLKNAVKQTIGANRYTRDMMTQTVLEILIRSIEEYIQKRSKSMGASVTCGAILTVLKNVVEQTTRDIRNTHDKMTQAVLETVFRCIEDDIQTRNIAMGAPVTYGVILTVLENIIEQTTGANTNTSDTHAETPAEANSPVITQEKLAGVRMYHYNRQMADNELCV